MYSYEIERLIKNHKYYLPSDVYTNICQTSPQISRVKFEPFGNYFEMWTYDSYYWRFQVFPNLKND